MQIRRLRPRRTSAERIASSSHLCSSRATSGSSRVAQSLTRWNFGATDNSRRSRLLSGLPAVSATALSKFAHQYALMSSPCSSSNFVQGRVVLVIDGLALLGGRLRVDGDRLAPAVVDAHEVRERHAPFVML